MVNGDVIFEAGNFWFDLMAEASANCAMPSGMPVDKAN
jgi:hypothetical protein